MELLYILIMVIMINISLLTIYGISCPTRCPHTFPTLTVPMIILWLMYLSNLSLVTVLGMVSTSVSRTLDQEEGCSTVTIMGQLSVPTRTRN